jgi:siroheme synthase-like protein
MISHLYYPIFLNLRGKRCTVVGGGAVALRKVKTLLGSGADVTVISPTLHPRLAQFLKKNAIRLIQRNYRAGDLKGSVIVIAATDVKEINRNIAEAARRVGALVNVVDDPDPSSFIIPSFFRTGDLTLAVSTGGKSPALASKIRTRLEKDFGKEYAAVLSLISEVRSVLKKKKLKVDPETWQKALDLDVLIPLVKSGKSTKAKTILFDKLTQNP